jgi:hypothetical protein
MLLLLPEPKRARGTTGAARATRAALLLLLLLPCLSPLLAASARITVWTAAGAAPMPMPLLLLPAPHLTLDGAAGVDAAADRRLPLPLLLLLPMRAVVVVGVTSIAELGAGRSGGEGSCRRLMVVKV